MDILELAEKGKIKRIFRARNKISFTGAVCHITQRAAGKEPLFLEEGDYLYMLHLLKEGSKKFSIEIFSYALMPNHVHLLIRLSKDNLSESMKDLYGKYAVFFNKKYERKGHVFGAAFRQALCFSDNYLLAASLYIHSNAVRSNIVYDPIKYRWSSCGLYLKSFKGKTFINYKFILGILNSDIIKAKKIYKQLLDQTMQVKTYEVWEEPKALELFKNKIMEFLPNTTIRNNFQEDFLDEQRLEEKIVELRTNGRLRSPQSLKARKFLIGQLRARGYTLEYIGKMLGVSRQAVHKIIS